MITLCICLALSVCLNGVLIWYARRLTGQFVFFADNVKELENTLEEFGTHLENVHELEMFYGDETLASLIKHSRYIVDVVKQFYEGFAVEGDQEEDGDQEDGST
tara:strand:- start:307 stop:618 length:312 start_codon:yes stop_codon:yes gene_type:complete